VGKEFGTVMTKVFEHLAGLDLDEKTVNSIGRLIHIWEERSIFHKRIQADVARIWAERRPRARERSPHTPPLPAKRPHVEQKAAAAAVPAYQPSAKAAVGGDRLPSYLDIDFR
jgi:hypothetical protein